MSLPNDENRLTIVTQGGDGVGTPMHEDLVRQGLRLIMPDIDRSNAEHIAAGLGPGRMDTWANVTGENSVAAQFDTAEAKHGPASVLVCATHLAPHPSCSIVQIFPASGHRMH